MLEYRPPSSSARKVPEEPISAIDSGGVGSSSSRSSPSSEDTRLRLLNAAGEVFAERGFKEATVRDICGRANANIAAVNYHFGDKYGLYSALLQYTDRLETERHPEFPQTAAFIPPAERLGIFIRQFVGRAFDQTKPTWHERLLAREMVDPTPALHDLIRERIKPRALALQSLVRELLGPGAGDADVQLAACSVIGQLLIYHKCKVVVCELMPAVPISNNTVTLETIDTIAHHVTAFSLAGLNHLAAKIAARPVVSNTKGSNA